MFRANQLSCWEVACHVEGFGSLYDSKDWEGAMGCCGENLRVVNGELTVARKKDHGGKKSTLRIVRHKNAHKKYLMEGLWEILEHQQ